MTDFVPFMARRAIWTTAQAGAALALGLWASGHADFAKAAPLSEQSASPWVVDLHSALRLTQGPQLADGTRLGAIAIRLDPGWKTYWRTPGDSGVPPRFDFSASDNVASVTVLWPAPKAFPDGAGGTSFGYQTQVVLPLRIVATAPDAPVTLRARVDYAVCEKLCLPVDAKSELTLRQPAPEEDPTLTAALARVPQPAAIGTPEKLGIRAVRREGDRVVVDVAAPPEAHLALFAEGPTLEWALPPPQPQEGAPAGTRRFGFALEGLPADAQAAGAALKLTLVTDDKAYEYDVTLQ
jgi:DsbC/DsbD-like thiol-disulfide interchange protein